MNEPHCAFEVTTKLEEYTPMCQEEALSSAVLQVRKNKSLGKQL